MALLQIKLQEPLYTNHYLEAIFYDHYTELTKAKLERFVPLARVASLMDCSDQRALTFLIQSSILKGIEGINLTTKRSTILIHPDTLLKLLSTRARRGLKHLFIYN